MAKLCPKGKAAAKRKFKVYPSAYANMYASKVCKGKVRASAADGGMMRPMYKSGGKVKDSKIKQIVKTIGSPFTQIKDSIKPKRKKYESGGFVARGCGKIMSGRSKKTKVY